MSTSSVPPTAPALPVLATALPAKTASKARAASAVDNHSILLKECSFRDFTGERRHGAYPVRREEGARVEPGGPTLTLYLRRVTKTQNGAERSSRLTRRLPAANP